MMMIKHFFAFLLVVVTTVSSPLVYAKAPEKSSRTAESVEPKSLDLFRASLRIETREYVKDAMELTPSEDKAFWSIYHKYEADLMRLNDRRLKLVKGYGKQFATLTEGQADSMAQEFFAIRKERIALLEDYYGKIAKSLSKRTAARFIQVESVLQAAGDVQVGTHIPLIPK